MQSSRQHARDPEAAPRRVPISRRSLAQDRPVDYDNNGGQARSPPGLFARGEPGRNGLDGLPGLDGAPGLDGVPGLDGRNGKDGANGRDGRDGQPGERGPTGPQGLPGAPGKSGRRGPPGPAGETGPPGQPGVCAYRAKFDCAHLADNKNNNNNTNAQTREPRLLMAPTIVGGPSQSSGQINGQSPEERQVSVNEGDNIQLSCEAFGLPRPTYVWLKADRHSAILLDASADLKVTSYAGSQLPLASVDRLQAGSYECLASNGVPPTASKRISLDINYAPTIRLYPPESISRVRLGASVLVECLVEANPSALVYWMFADELIMSVPGETSHTRTEPPNQMRHKKYVITESTGQLSTGVSYSLLTLNISQIERNDLGQYKCVGKNLVGQSVGSFWLLNEDQRDQFDQQTSAKAVASVNNWLPLDRWAGWPSHLVERNGIPARYATFGNEHRQHVNSSAKKLLAESMANAFRRISLVQDSAGGSASSSQHELTGTLAKQIGGEIEDHADKPNTHKSGPKADKHHELATAIQPAEANNVAHVNYSIGHDESRLSGDDDLDLCRVESSNDFDTKQRLAHSLLDQVGKPVYIGNGMQSANGPINWWSLDSKLRPTNSAGRYYVTTGTAPDRLFEYENIAALLKDLQQQRNTSNESFSQLEGHWSRAHKLKYPMASGGSQLVYGGKFFYVTRVSQFDSSDHSNGLSSTSNIPRTSVPSSSRDSLDELIVTMLNLDDDDDNFQYLRLSSDRLSLYGWSFGDKAQNGTPKQQHHYKQPLGLGPEYKLNRVELVSDENGVWLIVPTIELVSSGLLARKNDKSRASSSRPTSFVPEEGLDVGDGPADKLIASTRLEGRWTRRLHVLKLRLDSQATSSTLINDASGATKLQKLAKQHDYHAQQEEAIRQYHNNNNLIDIEYHVSMKLDWRMIGQMFIIDGVLYGIKDRHSYSSKLQFAYDIYKCKLLSTDYLNEPHRTFTNHFGNTQMIKYNPNEPKRLYTIDSGNLLWCPVKLIKSNPDDIWPL